MRSLHVIAHARPALVSAGGSFTIGQQAFRAVSFDGAIELPAFAITFDHAIACLEELPRMFVEPDGSFVWVSSDEPTPWQLDGQLHDGQLGLMHVELKGAAPTDRWRELLSCFGWPNQSFVFQCVREGVFVDDATFWSIVGDL